MLAVTVPVGAALPWHQWEGDGVRSNVVYCQLPWIATLSE